MDRPFDHVLERRADDEGFALVAVLFFLLLATAILTPFSLAARNHFNLVRNSVDNALVQQSLENIFGLGAQLQVLALSNQIDWKNPQLKCVVDASSDGSSYVFEYVNHAGLIDLNAAGAPLLAVGLTAAGLGVTEARELTELVLMFRTQRPPNENGSYEVRSDQPLGGPKYGLFEAVEELFDFPQMRKIDRDRLSDIFTVHSRSGTVDISRAPNGLRNLIEAQGQERASYVVTNSKRVAAFSLRITLADEAEATRTAAGVFAVDVANSRYRILEPIVHSFRDSRLDASTTDDELCETFFTEQNMITIREVSN